MVKYYTFILTFLLIWSTCMPCNDINTSRAKTDVQMSGKLNDQDHSGLQHVDGCGPFCTCACCSMVVNFNFQHVGSTLIVYKSVKLNSRYLFYAPNGIAMSIWQPPQ